MQRMAPVYVIPETPGVYVTSKCSLSSMLIGSGAGFEAAGRASVGKVAAVRKRKGWGVWSSS